MQDTTETMGRKETELTQPQNNNQGSQTAELTQPREDDKDVITPEDIARMTSEEFSDYIDNRPQTDEPVEDNDIEVSGSEEPIAFAEGKQHGGKAAEREPTTQEQSGGDPAENEPPAPYRTFNTREEYEADRNRAIDKAFKKRFNEKDRDELARIRRSARGNYRGSKNPVQEMLDELDNHAAEEAGQTVEDYRKSLSENEEFERWKAEKADGEKQREQNERIIAAWQSDAEALKEVAPGFDFNTAMSNPVFNAAIRNGESVAMAYMRMQSSGGGAAQAVQSGAQPPRPQRKEIPQNAASGVKGTGGSSRNPATMPTSDYIAYINKQAGRKLL